MKACFHCKKGIENPFSLLIGLGAARVLFIGQLAFVGDHALFLLAGFLALLAADFFDLLLAFGENAVFDFVDPIAEFFAGEVAIELTGALALAFDLDARGLVFQVNARRRFVDLLPARTGTGDEFFHKIILADVQHGHPFFLCSNFFRGDHFRSFKWEVFSFKWFEFLA